MKTTVSIVALMLSLGAGALHATPQAEVQEGFRRIVDGGGFRARVQGNVFGPELPAVSGEIDVLFPDRIHVRSEHVEFIVLPAGAWVGTLGVWAPTERSLVPVTDFDPARMREAIESIRDVHTEGRARTSQCEARAYRFRASGQLPGTAADGDVRLWVCEPGGRIARIEAIGDAGVKVVVDFDWSRPPVVSAP